MKKKYKYNKALVINLDSLEVSLIGFEDHRANANIFSSEILDFAARLSLIGSKCGRVNTQIVNGAFDE